MKLNMCVKFVREVDLDSEKIFPEVFEIFFGNKKIKFYFEDVEGCMYENDKSIVVYTLKSPVLVNKSHYEKKFDKFIRALETDEKIDIRHIVFEFDGRDAYINNILAMSFELARENTDVTINISKDVMENIYIT